MPITPASSAPTFVSTQVTPLTPSPEIEYTFSIKILNDWTDDLQDKDSDAFREMSSQLESELKKKLSGIRNFIGVKVLSFRKGSIVAEFQLIFSTKVQPKEALDMMKEKMNDGNLGRLRVDPASLEYIQLKTEEPEDKELPYAMIIGACFAALFVVVLWGILFCRFYKKRKAEVRRKRNSGDMLPDGGFPNSEKYEMKLTENTAYEEETDPWGEHKAGMSNKGFQWHH
ncbi:uncharacterized protein [Montipora foliosa]|uniref:uncharacterized protein n=1 Tax=Montipora foliosa TaxID=591990 RepID=UPI0035F1C632